MILLESFFYFSVFLVFYVYFGYPLILKVFALKTNSFKKLETTPSVILFIPAYNEEKVIGTKIENCLALDYPEDKLKIIVASDGSTDNTETMVKKFLDKKITFFRSKTRKGKNSIINEFIQKCDSEIIIFTDANCGYKEDTIKKLVRNFSDEKVGCVVGNLKYINEKSSVGKGESLYFRYESMIKKLESKYGSLVAANGSIYAIRKNLFSNLDLDVANDLAHPIQIADRGYKIVFESEAIAYEKATSSSKEEFDRRSRIVTRGITASLRYWRKYHMLKGMWGFCFVSHKLIRWFLPFFLILILLSNFLLNSLFFKIILYLQLLFYFMGLTGYFLKNKSNRLFSIPFYFCLINTAALVGVLNYFIGKRHSIWEIAETTR